MKTFRLVFMILIMEWINISGRAHVCWDDLEFKQFPLLKDYRIAWFTKCIRTVTDIFGSYFLWIVFVMMVTRYVPINQIFIPLVFWLIIMCFVWKKIIPTGFVGTHEGLCMLDKRTGEDEKLQLDGVQQTTAE